MDGMRLLRCICDETRFSILQTLGRGGEMPVGHIAAAINREQPLVSHHLKILKSCGILSHRVDGRRILYRISSIEMTMLISDILSTSERISNLCACAETECCAPDMAVGN